MYDTSTRVLNIFNYLETCIGMSALLFLGVAYISLLIECIKYVLPFIFCTTIFDVELGISLNFYRSEAIESKPFFSSL